MSKSLKRVQRALEDGGISYRLEEMTVETRTAQQAADAVNCHLDQIAKSMVVAGVETGQFALFLTAGGNQIDKAKSEALLGEPTRIPKGDEVRRVTGFAIGGVSPVGHITPIRAFMDPRLLDFDLVWGAAGTPRHNFEIATQDLRDITGAEAADFVVTS